MSVAVDLLDAANKAPQNLRAKWVANTLQTAVTNFAADLATTFVEQTPNDRPIGDWLAIIAAFAPSILPFASTTAGTITQVSLAYDYVYRLCKFAYYYHAQGLITNTQRTAILTAYNARFA